MRVGELINEKDPVFDSFVFIVVNCDVPGTASAQELTGEIGKLYSNNPEYKNYENAVRKKIAESLNRIYDSHSSKKGKVTLIFKVKRDGHLFDIGIDPQKTEAPQEMIDVAVHALKNIDSFPPFPESFGKKYYDWSFSVLILFKYKKMVK